MYESLFENLIHYAWPPVLLLSVIWTILAIIFLFVRHQLRKEKQEKSLNNPVIDHEKEILSREIDELAVYVSKLPRPDHVIRDYRGEELENGND